MSHVHLQVCAPTPAVPPCDTITLGPSAAPDHCWLKVWDERGAVACEVHAPRARIDADVCDRILAWVRSWPDDVGVAAAGPTAGDLPLGDGPRIQLHRD